MNEWVDWYQFKLSKVFSKLHKTAIFEKKSMSLKEWAVLFCFDSPPGETNSCLKVKSFNWTFLFSLWVKSGAQHLSQRGQLLQRASSQHKPAFLEKSKKDKELSSWRKTIELSRRNSVQTGVSAQIAGSPKNSAFKDFGKLMIFWFRGWYCIFTQSEMPQKQASRVTRSRGNSCKDD